MKKLLLLSMLLLSALSPASDPFASLPRPRKNPVNRFPGYMKEKVHPCLPRVGAMISAMPMTRLLFPERGIAFEDGIKEAKMLFKAYDEIATPILNRSKKSAEIVNSLSVRDLLALQEQIGLYLATARGGGVGHTPRLGFRTQNMLVFYAERDEILDRLAKKIPLTQIGIDISSSDQEHLYKLITHKYMQRVRGGEITLIEKLVEDYYLPRSALSPKDREIINKIASFPEDFSKASELTENMLATLKRNIANGMHPVKAAALAHLELVRIHPFCHANGRTARTLFNIIVLAFGYPSLDFPEEAPYQKAIQVSLSSKNAAPFELYCISELHRIMSPENIKRLLTNASAESISSCGNCGAEEAPSRCGRCKIVKYCNEICQRTHWETHKLTCVAHPAIGGGASSAGAASSH